MSLNKEDCEKAIASAIEKTTEIDAFENIPQSTYCIIGDELNTFKQLIKEHFELVELFKKHELQGLSIKELDAWFDRSLWHVNKVNELSNQLVELSRDVKLKDEYITELRNYITQIEREFKDDPPLKFEKIK